MATSNFGPMCNEFSRLGTFSGFEGPLGVWPTQLAKAGFCRDTTCNDYEVVCFSCRLKLDARNLQRIPVFEIHKTMAPSCSFVMGSSTNQPVSLAPQSCGASQLRSNQDVNSFAAFSLPNWGSSLSQLPAFSSLPQFSQVSLSQVSESLPQVSESLPQVTYGSQFNFAGDNEEMDLVSVSDPFSQFSSNPGQGNLNLSSDTLEPSVLPSLPSDFLSNFQNAFLTSVVLPDVLLEGNSNPQSLTNPGVGYGASSNSPSEGYDAAYFHQLLEGDSNPQSLTDSGVGYGGSSEPPSEGRSTSYFSQFTSGVALGGPDEVVATDGEALEPEQHGYAVEAEEAEAQAYSKPSSSPVTQLAATPTEPPAKKTVTFDDLGIVVQRPKRQDCATVPVRLATFGPDWKKEGQYQTKEIMAEAGFYYAGYADCCRCFYCGGGLKNWEKEDHPWIEHCRWFKACPYVITNLGQDFIDAVQSLNRTNVKISTSDVEEEIKRLKLTAQQTIAASEVPSPQRQDSKISLDCDDVVEDGCELEAATRLESENDMLKQQNICKVCLDKEVSILYVPCGHLVTCSVCAPSMRDCPVCRQRIKGQVRVITGVD